MADITKCTGVNCPIRNDCKRYTSESNMLSQSFFTNPPHVFDDSFTPPKFSCDMFHSENQIYILTQLNNICQKKE
jgi:hypothetical protein